MAFVTNSGVRIFYKTEGAGEPLLLLMGLGADGETWRAHANAFLSRYRCIFVDNRGAGQSDAPDGAYSVAEMAADAQFVLENLGIRRVHVAGISMGGAIAQELALRAPEVVQSLIIVSSWAASTPYLVAILRMLQDAYSALDVAAFTRLLQLWIFSPGYFLENYGDLSEREAASAASVPMKRHAFLAQCEACIGHNALLRLRDIVAPTLITVGSVDIFTPPEESVVLHKNIANSCLELFKTRGHTHHWEDLEKFNAKVLHFLEKHPIHQD